MKRAALIAIIATLAAATQGGELVVSDIVAGERTVSMSVSAEPATAEIMCLWLHDGDPRARPNRANMTNPVNATFDNMEPGTDYVFTFIAQDASGEEVARDTVRASTVDPFPRFRAASPALALMVERGLKNSPSVSDHEYVVIRESIEAEFTQQLVTEIDAQIENLHAQREELHPSPVSEEVTED